MSGPAEAWLLQLAGRGYVALGTAELVHLLSEVPPLFSIPLARGPCRDLLLWEDRPVPLADLCALPPENARDGLVAIVAYDAQDSGIPSYGALRVTSVPRKCTVAGAEAVGPEEVAPALRRCAHAAFRHGTTAVPVLDLHALSPVPGGHVAL